MNDELELEASPRGTRVKLGLDARRTINFSPREVEWLIAWGLAQKPPANFSDAVRRAVAEFIERETDGAKMP